jgi:hypothetical protein
MPIPIQRHVNSQINDYPEPLRHLIKDARLYSAMMFQPLYRKAATVRLQLQLACKRRTTRPLNLITGTVIVMFGLCWCGDLSFDSRLDVVNQADVVDINAVAEQIIKVESNGDINAKNKRSSATGLGQFVNETWLRLIRNHRPDLAKDRSENEVLELRRDPDIAREMTVRFTERNAWLLRKCGLPVTPGTLYLAHFAGSAGAAAILSAEEQADAATIMAAADATRKTDRARLIKLNPFLDRLTIADLKLWADRKMRVSRL